MKICLISVEIFAFGKNGGFGKATRLIGRELVRRGHEVFAVVPRRSGQKPVEQLDGITVFGFPPMAPWTASKCLRLADADIYHSCEPSMATYFAAKAMPKAIHIVTIRDPRDFSDWKMEFELPSRSRLQVIHNYLYESNPMVRGIVPKMNAVFTTCRSLIPKVRSMYKLSQDPGFLPTPVEVPVEVKKAVHPTVCYMARLDRRKRPELFLDLARKFSDVHFIAAGKSRDPRWDRYLRAKYAGIPNLEMTGFIDSFGSNAHSEILGKSWIMVNTATREGLPNAFLEAAAHRCAILSSVDSDGFASKFGHYMEDDNFETGLDYLLENKRWEERGNLAYEHVSGIFAMETAMDRHIETYKGLMGN
jgi:glycosyltransferase involved in cell wall biosynthesis